WNHRDPAEIVGHMAYNGLYFDVPEQVSRTHDELTASLQEFFATYRHRYELVGDVVTNRNTIAFQYRMVPEDDGNKRSVYRGAEFITLSDDVAVTITDYYDVIDVSRPSILPQARSSNVRRPKYAKSGLDEQLLATYKSRLEQAMTGEKVFLRSDMTLPKLADIIDCSVNHLSQVINSGFGVSFFDYLNRYRIAYAREMLTQNDGRDSAILNIAYSVGFNSNSAFYAAFKKHVGQTPASYRKNCLKHSP
ncbi:MAG: helix-turn-helix domain-containing protein, partial [Pseudomonadota bacterium]